MKTRKLYLDTCILVGFYDERDRHHKTVKNLFSRFSKSIKSNTIQLYCSHFTMLEFTKKMVEKTYISRASMLRYRDEILRFKKIGEYPITILELEEKYKSAENVFEEFFLRDVQNIWLDVKNSSKRLPHLAYVIHATIMKRYKIKEVVTFDTREDKGGWENIKDIIVVLPKDIESYEIRKAVESRSVRKARMEEMPKKYF